MLEYRHGRLLSVADYNRMARSAIVSSLSMYLFPHNFFMEI